MLYVLLYDFIICCATFNIFCSYMIFLPVVQQSNKVSGQVVSNITQLSVPHTKFPSQSESLSQSPSPRAHGDEEVQQLASFWLASQDSKTSQKIENRIMIMTFYTLLSDFCCHFNIKAVKIFCSYLNFT